MLAPGRTLAITTGASEWPLLESFDAAPAFTNAAASISDYVGARGLGVPEENVLDLFGKSNSPQQYEQIIAFLDGRMQALGAPHGENLLILFFYVGHGAFFGTARDYCLLLADTRGPLEADTSLRVGSLDRLLRLRAPLSARMLFLDCCFAAEAARIMQGAIEQVVGAKTDEILEVSPLDRGVALFCAASARDPARLAGRDTHTLFNWALFEALRNGDPLTPGPMTLHHVAELAGAALDGLGQEGVPRPEVHVPNQAYGDLAAVPLFPNPAAPTIKPAPPADQAGRAGPETQREPEPVPSPVAKEAAPPPPGTNVLVPQTDNFMIWKAVTCSADGRYYAGPRTHFGTPKDSFSIQVVEAMTGRPLHDAFHRIHHSFDHGEVSSRDQLLGLDCLGRLYVRDLADHRGSGTELLLASDVRSAGFHPNGTLVASGRAGGLSFYAAGGFDKVATLPQYRAGSEFGFSADGSVLATFGIGKGVQFWHGSERDGAWVPENMPFADWTVPAPYRESALSPDGTALAVLRETDRVEVLSTRDGSPLWRATVTSGPGRPRICYAGSSHSVVVMFSGVYRGILRKRVDTGGLVILDAATGKTTHVFPATALVTDMAPSPDGRSVLVCEDGLLRLWSVP
ncbi:hypothetical protein [Streptomyces sp. NBC_01244]|uniref:hypothetical protein n=1 Tax=Streptomyces sp. NBC_01244 TaxID=2903797 RepID=UPI002E105025|nr:hypothetical protein OG247_14365 [Streptomyces sp. NBC_01244]